MKTLKPCRDCGTEVSPNAKTCPKCGCEYPVGKPAAYGAAQILVIVFGVFVAVGIIAQQMQPDPATQRLKEMNDQSEAGLKRIEDAARRAREVQP